MGEEKSVAEVVGIRFKRCGKIYDFEVDGLDVTKGDRVVVESELGLSMGNIVTERREGGDAKRELKRVLRKATEDDLKQKADNESVAAEAMAYCSERVMARGLPMKLICTEVTLDRKRFVFYFTAEGRIDFRELVKDLAAKFKTRIEMRQIGVRDATKILGGIGICGKEVCCKRFLTAFEPISIRMAKSQELVLNANKLSGVCGRLMCCLGYEYGSTARAEEGDPEEEATLAAEGTEKKVEVFEEPLPVTRDEHKPAGSEKGVRETPRARAASPARGEQRGPRKRMPETAEATQTSSAPEVRDNGEQQESAESPQGLKEGRGKRFHRRRRPGKRFRK